MKNPEIMGRTTAALLIALSVSLGLHIAALFLPEIDSSPEPEARPMLARLRPAPPEKPPEALPPAPAAVPMPREAAKEPEIKRISPRRKKTPRTAAPVLAVPGDGPPLAVPPEPETMPENAAPPSGTESPEPAPLAPGRLPPSGRIRFRVDWGDSGFEIGFARQEWTFEAGRYRLVSTVETTGLAWLLRSVSIEMESMGRVSAEGLRPDVFGVRRPGQKARERALFDWETQRIRVSDDRDYTLDSGAQDLLSFHYQLGFLAIAPGETGEMALATGKKYGVYRLENLGDEMIDIPLGTLRTRHLRAPGENATEMWLAYDYRLLPVKIRHVDNKGDAFVQMAAEIEFGP